MFKYKFSIINRIKLFEILKLHLKIFIFKKLTKKGLNLFFNFKDGITLEPLLNGTYEASLNKIISKYNKKKYSDFLIDIGSNIGLTSSMNGNLFKKVICYEPNELCLNILKTNLKISIRNNFVIYNYGLGYNDKTEILNIPKKNWGGAFIFKKNLYSNEELAQKDGFSKIDNSNYIKSKVKIQSSEKIFRKLFINLKKKKLNKGIIKIDVEGYETPILEGISKTLPKNFKIIICFENWKKNFNDEKIKKIFKKRLIFVNKIEGMFHHLNYSKFKKFFFYLIGFSNHIVEIPLSKSRSKIGDIILKIE